MSSVIVTKEIIEKRNKLLRDAEELRNKGCADYDLVDRLYYDYGWDFIDYKEMFNSSDECYDFIKVSEAGNTKWSK